MALDEINVLTPMRRTENGVAALNTLLQDALNPASDGKTQIEAGDAVLREGEIPWELLHHPAPQPAARVAGGL
jgi:exodeoxyribonuclease V alpha subunit